MNLEGRWTIHPGEAATPFLGTVGGFTPKEPANVVPCDDAAVERGAKALARGYGREGEWGEYAALTEVQNDEAPRG